MTLFYDELDELEEDKKKSVCVYFNYEYYALYLTCTILPYEITQKKSSAWALVYNVIPWPWLLPTDLNYIKKLF